jgi:hypothetical protein
VPELGLSSRNSLGASVDRWRLIAGRRSKTVAFVAIFALTTFGALATASAQPADIIAVNEALQDHYARGNYPAAQIDAQELERLAKAAYDFRTRALAAQLTSHLGKLKVLELCLAAFTAFCAIDGNARRSSAG